MNLCKHCGGRITRVPHGWRHVERVAMHHIHMLTHGRPFMAPATGCHKTPEPIDFSQTSDGKGVMDGQTATVTELPLCDIHKHEHKQEVPAEYDARIVSGTWAYVCGPCFVLCTTHNGSRLGTGVAQKLVVTA